MPQVSFTTLVEAARSGNHLVSFPTDTVPALATAPAQAELIYTAKQRSLDKPLILLAADAAALWSFVSGSATERAIWQKMAERYFPGALTLVLPASDRVPPAMNPKDPTTIGVRVPNHAIARAILAETGALATTSANLSGQPALQTLTEIEAQFPDVFTLSPQALEQFAASSTTASGVPSTVAKWSGTTWQILRQGAVNLEDVG